MLIATSACRRCTMAVFQLLEECELPVGLRLLWLWGRGSVYAGTEVGPRAIFLKWPEAASFSFVTEAWASFRGVLVLHA
jgi:hypothetical protein